MAAEKTEKNTAFTVYRMTAEDSGTVPELPVSGSAARQTLTFIREISAPDCASAAAVYAAECGHPEETGTPVHTADGECRIAAQGTAGNGSRYYALTVPHGFFGELGTAGPGISEYTYIADGGCIMFGDSSLGIALTDCFGDGDGKIVCVRKNADGTFPKAGISDAEYVGAVSGTFCVYGYDCADRSGNGDRLFFADGNFRIFRRNEYGPATFLFTEDADGYLNSGEDTPCSVGTSGFAFCPAAADCSREKTAEPVSVTEKSLFGEKEFIFSGSAEVTGDSRIRGTGENGTFTELAPGRYEMYSEITPSYSLRETAHYSGRVLLSRTKY